MKISIIYYSETGCTHQAAEWIAAGADSVPHTETKLFNLCGGAAPDTQWVTESDAVIFGTPTYYANMCWQMKQWFDASGRNFALAGKLGAAFATENSPFGGGGELAVTAMLEHMLVYGMVVYSSGSSCGQPFIHTGPTIVRDVLEERRPLCEIFGRRIAEKAHALFEKER